MLSASKSCSDQLIKKELIIAQVDKILKEVSKHRRVAKDKTEEKMEEHPKEKPTSEYAGDIQIKLKKMVSEGKKIRFVLPSFPYKSPVRGKTLGDTPDMAEIVSLTFLNQFCLNIKSVYPEGAEIVIYTDRFAFEKVLPDIYKNENMRKYTAEIEKIITNRKLINIQYINLEGRVDLANYEESDEKFHERIRNPKSESDRNSVNLFCGLKHFYETELEMGYPGLSHKRIRKNANEIARGMARMSAALSNCLAVQEPDAIRLSCHPKTSGSDKIGIWFNPDHSLGIGGTPWHNAAVFEICEDSKKCAVTFMKAKDAIHSKEKYILKYDSKENPSHFVSKSVFHHASVIQAFFQRIKNKKVIHEKDSIPDHSKKKANIIKK